MAHERGNADANSAEAGRRVAAERGRIERLVAMLASEHDHVVAASLDTNADDEHDPEGATIAFERSQVDALLRKARRDLDDVADAEHRLRSGEYGLCTVCGVEISAGRLEARPTAAQCIVCARGAAPGR